LAFVLAACSDDTKGPTPDGGGKKEGGTVVDKGPQPTKLICKADKSDCKDFVFSKLILPTSDAQKYALQYEGKPYNALGAILGALSSVLADLQGSVDGAVNNGTTVILLRFQSTNFTDDPNTLGQNWIGAKPANPPCCAKPDDKAACATESKTTCFKGDFKFEVDANSPQDAVFGGKITASTLDMKASVLPLKIPITTAGVIQLNLKSAQLKGKLGATGITDGVLAGAISKKEVDTVLIPTVAKMMQDTLADPKTPQSTKDQMLNLFDKSPKDGKITEQEVKENPLITTFLSGDVDVDKDGELDLSLGVGFEGAGAVINK
jgi:hypothetical protein